MQITSDYKLDVAQADCLLFHIQIHMMELSTFISLAFYSCFCIAHITHHSCLCSALATGNETDQAALLHIKMRITSDPFGVLASWNESIHFCNWRGVTCGRRHKRVTRLDLQSLKLAGSISPHIGNLSFLRQIWLYNNSFSQEIPPQISRLRRLQDLHLNNNSLSGVIPSELSACSQLLNLSLEYNSLVGEIPKELGALSKLRKIYIHVNKLTGGIPYSFGNLSSLDGLSAASNYLSGSIPDSLGRLTNLTFLGLGVNRLSGTIPPSIFNLSSISVFDVGSNKIHGSLPLNLGSAFPNLEVFTLSCNQFTGPIPTSISNASNIFYIELPGNKLHGKVPSLKNLHRLEWLVLAENHLGSGEAGDLTFLCDLSNATRLQIVEIYQNDFGGTLPQCIGNLPSSLSIFQASRNKISGSIPNEFANLVNLETLGLAENQFIGPIPADFGQLQKLYNLYMNGNSLTENVPSSFGNLTSLAVLDLHGNQLQGNIPSSLAECHNLMILSLDGNNLSGILPQKIMDIPSIHNLSLAQNSFTGSLPWNIGKMINLEFLDVSRNMLSGVIPPTLGSCIKLEYLYMHENFFKGSIPSSLGPLRGLKELYLSRNNLSGLIPEFLERFQVLQSLNLSYNNLEGMVPVEGVFKNTTATSVEGNSKLCGGIPEFHLQKCKLQKSEKGGWTRHMKLIICLVLGILGVTSAVACLYIRCISKRKKQSTSNDSDNFLRVSYQSLLKATDGFSSSNLIGNGSFGSVFKGVLEQGETTIAIKVLNLVRHGAYKSFTAECEALRNIRHRNLVKVLSACSGVDYSGHDFKALIYEFMVNGSLDEWLHPTLRTQETTERTRSLSFSQRLNIAINVAMAIDYLHHHCGTPIVHCDLKPSNILLDHDMVGHVGDFGLARFLPKPEENSSANQLSSAGVKGTIGYAPPEYGMGHEVWTPGDVYSYGILLLEIFTAKRPTDAMFQGSATLHNFVKTALPDQVVEILDPVLVQEYVGGDMLSISNHTNRDNTSDGIKMEENLISISEVGVACSAESPSERLDISDVVAQMCRIRNKLEADRI